MSKRCKLQKEYYKEFGNYKGDGKYSDHYVKWLENEVLALRLYNVSQQRELLKAFAEQLRPALEIDIGFDYITEEDIEECIEAFNCG